MTKNPHERMSAVFFAVAPVSRVPGKLTVMKVTGKLVGYQEKNRGSFQRPGGLRTTRAIFGIRPLEISALQLRVLQIRIFQVRSL